MNNTDIRSEIQQIVSSIIPLDEVEQEHIRFVIDWINSGCEIFRIEKPARPDTHLVSYCVIVSSEMDQILLVDHKMAGRWLPPGGHVEPGEDPKETVRRETMEELGIEAEFLVEEPIFLTVRKTEGKGTIHTDVSLWYVLKGDPKQVLQFDPKEFYGIRWFRIDEIPFEMSECYLNRFLQKLQQTKI